MWKPQPRVENILAAISLAAALLAMVTLLDSNALHSRLTAAELRLVEAGLRQAEAAAALEEAGRQMELLNASLSRLAGEHAKLASVLFKPLGESVTPTLGELQEWLLEDNTSRIVFSRPGFMCGDYAVMLAMRARLMKWDLGIVVVRGIVEPGLPFCHAFNVAMCREGRVYIEPQTDEVFWLENHARMREKEWVKTPYGHVYVETYVEVLHYED